MELMPEIAERPVSVDEVIQRAQEKIDEKNKSRKKPLQNGMKILLMVFQIKIMMVIFMK